MNGTPALSDVLDHPGVGLRGTDTLSGRPFIVCGRRFPAGRFRVSIYIPAAVDELDLAKLAFARLAASYRVLAIPARAVLDDEVKEPVVIDGHAILGHLRCTRRDSGSAAIAHGGRGSGGRTPPSSPRARGPL